MQIQISSDLKFISNISSRSYPVRPTGFTADALLEYLWVIFQEIDTEGVSKDAFERLLLKDLGVEIDTEYIGDSGASGIIDGLKSYSIPPDVILHFLYIAKNLPLRTKKGKAKTEMIQNPFKYAMRVFDTEYFNEVKAEEENIGKRFFLMEEPFNNYFKELQRVDIVSFIYSLFYNNHFGDMEVEKRIMNPVLEEYKKHFKNDKDHLLIVDPNPLYLNLLYEDSLNYNIDFLFYAKELCELYCDHYHSGNMFWWNDQDFVNEVMPNPEKNDMKKGRTRRLKNPEYHRMDFRHKDNHIYNRVIIFGHQKSNKEIKHMFMEFGRYFKDEVSMDFIIPNIWMDKDYEFRNLLCENMSIDTMMILSAEPFTSNIKKHVYVSAEGGRSDSVDSFKVCRSHYIQKEMTGSRIKGWMIREPWNLEVSLSAFLGEASRENGSTIIQMFENVRPKPIKGNRNVSKKFNLTKEIQIWFTWTGKKRGSISYYETLEPAETKSKRLNRGKRMFSIPVNAESVERLVENAKKRLLQGKGHGENTQMFITAIVEDIEKAYLSEPNREVSLMTYWFARQAILAENRYYNRKKCLTLFDSEWIANIMSSDRIEVHELEKEIRKTIKNVELDDVIGYLRQINFILKEANREGLFLDQDVSEYVYGYTSKKKGYRDVRKFLTKKSYVYDEAKFIYSYLALRYKETGESKYLGALISYFTGCLDREVAALRGGDIHNMTKLKNHRQLWIYSELKEDGKRHNISIKSKERYRKIPIVRVLDQLLRDHAEKRLKDAKGNAVLDSEPFLYHLDGSKMRYISPNEIREAKVEVEKKLGLDSEEGFATTKDKVIETDFNRYQGDRFRTNLEYQLSQNSNMNKAEINYLLGRTQESTYAKHYCDFSNDFSQIALKTKMDRWSSAMLQMVDANGDVESGEIRSCSVIRKSPGKKVEEKREDGAKVVTIEDGSSRRTAYIKTESIDPDVEVCISIEDLRGAELSIDILEDRWNGKN